MIEVLQTEVFRLWLERLRDRRARVRIAARILAVQEGHFGDWKAIDRAVSELRVHVGAGYRIYIHAARRHARHPSRRRRQAIAAARHRDGTTPRSGTP